MMEALAAPMPAKAAVWLITGCSTGFGRALVTSLLARGDKVIATARKLHDLDYIRDNRDALPIQLDVCEPEHVLRQKIEQAIQTMGGAVDVLVNNAGYVSSGVWEELSDEDARAQIETNVWGSVKITRILLGKMRPRRKGVVLFMGSISGWDGLAGMGPYSVSKYALQGLAESLSKEVAPLGIRVHLLVIARFRTSILSQQNRKDKLEREIGIAEYAKLKELVASGSDGYHGRQKGDPEAAAERIIDVAKLENLSTGQLENLPVMIPFGSEAVAYMSEKCNKVLQDLEVWDSFARSSDYV